MTEYINRIGYSRQHIVHIVLKVQQYLPKKHKRNCRWSQKVFLFLVNVLIKQIRSEEEQCKSKYIQITIVNTHQIYIVFVLNVYVCIRKFMLCMTYINKVDICQCLQFYCFLPNILQFLSFSNEITRQPRTENDEESLLTLVNESIRNFVENNLRFSEFLWIVKLFCVCQICNFVTYEKFAINCRHIAALLFSFGIQLSNTQSFFCFYGLAQVQVRIKSRIIHFSFSSSAAPQLDLRCTHGERLAS